jgi:uroporphyrinogen III methyltransferase / synthase
MKHRTVLITRPREQSEELSRELESCGFQVLFFPAIQIAPPSSWEACDRSLDRPPAYYDGIIFTSVNGVKGFMRRMQERDLAPARYGPATIYAVGPKTAEELESNGLKASFVPEQHSGEALGQHLSAGEIHGKRFLFPRGNLGSAELLRLLDEAGAEVHAVEVYRTVTPDMSGAKSLVERIFQDEIDVLAFASPSAARNFTGAVPGGSLVEISAHTKIAAIGPSTFEMVQTLGGRGALVAKTSTARGLAEAISEHFGDHG